MHNKYLIVLIALFFSACGGQTSSTSAASLETIPSTEVGSVREKRTEISDLFDSLDVTTSTAVAQPTAAVQPTVRIQTTTMKSPAANAPSTTIRKDILVVPSEVSDFEPPIDRTNAAKPYDCAGTPELYRDADKIHNAKAFIHYLYWNCLYKYHIPADDDVWVTAIQSGTLSSTEIKTRIYNSLESNCLRMTSGCTEEFDPQLSIQLPSGENAVICDFASIHVLSQETSAIEKRMSSVCNRPISVASINCEVKQTEPNLDERCRENYGKL